MELYLFCLNFTVSRKYKVLIIFLLKWEEKFHKGFHFCIVLLLKV